MAILSRNIRYRMDVKGVAENQNENDLVGERSHFISCHYS
ncbi:hypothetical protein J2Z48_003155 [Croceifilum oryzae]|uniref:Uncharacterized protein n=1 Tax=Croceifilum oryzae TaxID=1553429 RepID=A0AAJ1TQ48_9BACL|nr:hypothetical protein [Croceifilum oryzae]